MQQRWEKYASRFQHICIDFLVSHFLLSQRVCLSQIQRHTGLHYKHMGYHRSSQWNDIYVFCKLLLCSVLLDSYLFIKYSYIALSLAIALSIPLPFTFFLTCFHTLKTRDWKQRSGLGGLYEYKHSQIITIEFTLMFTTIKLCYVMRGMAILSLSLYIYLNIWFNPFQIAHSHANTISMRLYMLAMDKSYQYNTPIKCLSHSIELNLA